MKLLVYIILELCYWLYISVTLLFQHILLPEVKFQTKLQNQNIKDIT